MRDLNPNINLIFSVNQLENLPIFKFQKIDVEDYYHNKLYLFFKFMKNEDDMYWFFKNKDYEKNSTKSQKTFDLNLELKKNINRLNLKNILYSKFPATIICYKPHEIKEIKVKDNTTYLIGEIDSVKIGEQTYNKNSITTDFFSLILRPMLTHTSELEVNNNNIKANIFSSDHEKRSSSILGFSKWDYFCNHSTEKLGATIRYPYGNFKGPSKINFGSPKNPKLINNISEVNHQNLPPIEDDFYYDFDAIQTRTLMALNSNNINIISLIDLYHQLVLKLNVQKMDFISSSFITTK